MATTKQKTTEKRQSTLLTALGYADLRVRWGVARARAAGLQPDDEFRGLYVSDEQVDSLLGMQFGQSVGFNQSLNGHNADWQSVIETARNDVFQSDNVITQLMSQFDLNHDEIDVLLIALLPEIDRRYERLFAYLQDDVTQKRPSVDLILNLLTSSFSEKMRLRRLFTDTGRLLQSRLLVRFPNHNIPEPPLLSQFVRPAPRLAEHLLGQVGMDDALSFCAELEEFPIADPHMPLPEIAERHLAEQARMIFIGKYGAGQTQTARMIAEKLGVPLLRVNLHEVDGDKIETLRLAMRDGGLLDAVLFISGWDLLLDNEVPPQAIWQDILAYRQIVVMSGEKIWYPRGERGASRVHIVYFENPDYLARGQLWTAMTGLDSAELERLINHFKFTPGQIRDAVATAYDNAAWEGAELTEQHLLLAARAHSNQGLIHLATKITPHYSWKDIILPPDTMSMLREAVESVQNRPIVYKEWGFGKKQSLGKGLNAMFAGESGTGKTMSADIIANELGLDLYKINLSTIISKYIGETEKNLERIFTEAETSNAVLFFDEADALFGKRSEVKDSHDRYANIETGYLLQRMEAFDGIVILATNLRANLDDAFTRRLHFIIEFPFPEPVDRERIWQVNLPKEAPLADDVDFKLLAKRFRLAGGSIRNIILAAAFLAARQGQPIGMSHLLHAARREYQKQGRLINEALFALDS